ncbi:MAG: protein-glutamate O-methyltransferase CheR [Deltaproteobacteria bacterium]|nr:protein-glutamate O-methyltransferase CheR [Nannocystaceae bacterium]
MSSTLDPTEFAWLCAFLRAESALSIDAGKDYLVTTRLTPLLKEFGLSTLSELVVRLKRRPIAAVHQRVIEAMTTNETSFFRDVHPFDTLRNQVLPEVVKKRGTAGLNIWCAASSTGQEPYTIAMVLHEAFPEVAARSRILCTDINQLVLERTKQGVYSQLEVNRGLPALKLVKYFDRRGTEWQVKEVLRRMVDTRLMNLAVPWIGVPIMDIVFVRNVLIYFDVETKRQIVGRIRRNMTMDGALFVGGAESLLNIDNDFARASLGKSLIYKRAA